MADFRKRGGFLPFGRGWNAMSFCKKTTVSCDFNTIYAETKSNISRIVRRDRHVHFNGGSWMLGRAVFRGCVETLEYYQNPINDAVLVERKLQ